MHLINREYLMEKKKKIKEDNSKNIHANAINSQYTFAGEINRYKLMQ